jgi:ATP-binding cassette subfamily B protein
MTAEENVALGRINTPIDEEKIKWACEMAGIAETLEQLPNSYKNMIGNYFEKGAELSIGQWQKLAIARAFYRNSEIILMDEPSSALDPETEQHLIQSLQLLAKEKTVLIISHRLSSIIWADQICLMENGEIIERGTHSELMQNKAKYASLFKMQNNVTEN